MKYLKVFEELEGWVNVKIDNQVGDRMKKYIKALDDVIDDEDSLNNLFTKIKFLNEIDLVIENERTDIRKKIAIITILQYLREIWKLFPASSAGFLFEKFLAALIYGKTPDDYSPTDIVSNMDSGTLFKYGGRSGKQLKYQIKLFQKDATINVNMGKTDADICDFYVIGIKVNNGIDVYIFNGKGISDDADQSDYIKDYAVVRRGKSEDGYISVVKGKRVLSLNTKTKEFKKFPYKMPLILDDIDELITQCGESIQEQISEIYDSISKLEYSVDALVSGYDQNNRLVSPEAAKARAEGSIASITNKLETLTDDLMSAENTRQGLI